MSKSHNKKGAADNSGEQKKTNQLLPHIKKPEHADPEYIKRVQAREKVRREFEEQMAAVTTSFEEKSLDIIFIEFPKRIKALDDLYNNAPEFNWEADSVGTNIDLPKDATKAQLKKFEVPCNEKMMKLIDILKKELLDMGDMISQLGIWVKLNIPRIEDGNNFGAEITEVLDATSESSVQMLDSFTAYHLARAELVYNVLKRPNIMDYHKALHELDAKIYLKTTLLAVDLRDNYLVLYNLITRNFEKIKSPRGTGEGYQGMY